jgi:hypothetical protein
MKHGNSTSHSSSLAPGSYISSSLIIIWYEPIAAIAKANSSLKPLSNINAAQSDDLKCQFYTQYSNSNEEGEQGEYA